MDEKEFKKSIEQLHAPQSAVDRAVKAALDAEEKRIKNPSAEKKKQKSKAPAIIKIVSASAACAVVATSIAAGGNMYNAMNSIYEKSEISMIISREPQNYFALMVDDETIENGEIISFAEADFSDIVSTDEIYAFMDENEDGTYSLRFRPTVSFPIGCTGSNIRSITYSTNGCTMALFEDESPDMLPFELVSYTLAQDEDYRSAHYHRRHSDDTNEKICMHLGLYYSQTIAYNSDNKTLGDMKGQCTTIFGPSAKAAFSSSKDKKLQEALEYITSFESKEAFDAFCDGKDRFDIKELLFRELIRNMSVDITVHYNDGSDMTMTVQFVPGEIQRKGFKASVNAKVSVVSDDDSQSEAAED